MIAKILAGLFGGMFGGMAVTYIQGLIAANKGPILADIDKAVSKLSANEKASLVGAVLILKQEFPEMANGGVLILVNALVSKYPALAPLQPILVSFLGSVEAEAMKDLAPAPVVPPAK